MATSYDQALKNLRSGGLTGAALSQAEANLKAYYDSQGQTLKAGTMAPGADPTLPGGSAQFGAGGRVEGKDGKLNQEAVKNSNEAIKKGLPQSVSGNLGKNAIKDPLVTSGPYKGMLSSAAANLKKLQGDSTSALTSYTFNPDTISGGKKAIANLNLKLTDINNDSWNSKGTKKDKAKGVFESTANDIAKLFTSKDDFDKLYGANLDFKNAIDAYTKAGGDTNSIYKRIVAPPSLVPTQAPGMPATQDPQKQTTQQYLASLTAKPDPNATPEEKQAFNDLIPERELAQEQIKKLANVPQQYTDLYFGTPEQVGILQEKKIQAQEQKKIIAQKATDQASNLKAQADLAIQKSNADQEEQEATIEENRLAARNYTTGMLAKMGALNTTGAAPVILATLEQKYQQQAATLKNATNYNIKTIQLKLKDGVNQIETDRDDQILQVSSDLTKDRETVTKEVFQLQKEADTKMYALTSQAQKDLQSRTDKYVQEARVLAEKNAKAYAAAVKKGMPKLPSATAQLSGARNAIDQQLNSSRGTDSHVDPAIYQQAYARWIGEKRGTLKDFLLAFPPASYVNPENTSLPEYLRPKAPKASDAGSTSTGRSVTPS